MTENMTVCLSLSSPLWLSHLLPRISASASVIAKGMTRGIPAIFRYCCAPSAYDSVTVHCDGFDMLVYMVMECGCFECAEPPLVYAGIAMTADGDPLM